jgi:hypothetical protein
MGSNSFIIVLLLIMLTFVSCNKINEQNFKVFGEESLLKDCKINISTYKQIGYDNITSKYTGTEELKTLLFNGNSNIVESSEEDSFYTIYFSYKDSLVNKIVMENVFYGASDRIAHLYINKVNGTISMLFIGREAEIETKQGFETILVPLDDYFRLNKINKDELKNKEKKLFFDFYGR